MNEKNHSIFIQKNTKEKMRFYSLITRKKQTQNTENTNTKKITTNFLNHKLVS